MPIQKMTDDIYAIGAIDWDRTMFDALMPLPHGTSYNCYLVKGRTHTALIDTVEPDKGDELMGNLTKLAVEQLDYVIVNHAEQDHSGTLPRVLQRYPGARIICNNKCKEQLQDLLHIETERFRLINDGDTLDLGEKTLQFIFAAWVHWPETMLTLAKEDKILFSCDLFGSHLATSHLFAQDLPQVYESAKHYYAEIMMPFKSHIKKHMAKIQALEISLVAPSHGPVYASPQFIFDAYTDWISDQVRNLVVIPYVSMHGSTEKMVFYLVDALVEKGVSALPLNLSTTDLSRLTVALVDAATIVVASPVVNVGPHPLIVSALYWINSLKPKAKFLSIVGSYSWGSKMEIAVKEMLSALKSEFLPSVITRGLPRSENYAELNQLANEIAIRHKGLGILG